MLLLFVRDLIVCLFAVQTVLCAKSRDILPLPKDILGSYAYAQEQEFGQGQGSVRGERLLCLRETDAHKEFLFQFAQSVTLLPHFIDWAAHKCLSEYMTSSLEAFAVLQYVNNYEEWNEDFMQASMDEAIKEKGKGRETKRKFTSITRGAGKYCGWSKEGIALYNDVRNRIAEQRKDEQCAHFEYELKGKFFESKPVNAKRHSGWRGWEEEGDNEYSHTEFTIEDGVGVEEGAYTSSGRAQAITPDFGGGSRMKRMMVSPVSYSYCCSEWVAQ